MYEEDNKNEEGSSSLLQQNPSFKLDEDTITPSQMLKNLRRKIENRYPMTRLLKTNSLRKSHLTSSLMKALVLEPT